MLGVIENMSYFECDGCGKRHAIFGDAGAKTLQERFGLATLAELPITPELSAQYDQLASREVANKTVDIVIRALGKKVLEKPARPEVTHTDKTISLTWEDGTVATVSNVALRRACNCALCVDEMTRKPLLDPTTIPLDIKAEKIEMIGNYAILVDWSDGHNTGFFPFTQIRELAGLDQAEQNEFQGCEI